MDEAYTNAPAVGFGPPLARRVNKGKTFPSLGDEKRDLSD